MAKMLRFQADPGSSGDALGAQDVASKIQEWKTQTEMDVEAVDRQEAHLRRTLQDREITLQGLDSEIKAMEELHIKNLEAAATKKKRLEVLKTANDSLEGKITILTFAMKSNADIIRVMKSTRDVVEVDVDAAEEQVRRVRDELRDFKEQDEAMVSALEAQRREENAKLSLLINKTEELQQKLQWASQNAEATSDYLDKVKAKKDDEKKRLALLEDELHSKIRDIDTAK